jgi:hypothetical protein
MQIIIENNSGSQNIAIQKQILTSDNKTRTIWNTVKIERRKK